MPSKAGTPEPEVILTKETIEWLKSENVKLQEAMKDYVVTGPRSAPEVLKHMPCVNGPGPYKGFTVSKVAANPRRRTFVQWLLRIPRIWDVTVTFKPESNDAERDAQ